MSPSPGGDGAARQAGLAKAEPGAGSVGPGAAQRRLLLRSSWISSATGGMRLLAEAKNGQQSFVDAPLLLRADATHEFS